MKSGKFPIALWLALAALLAIGCAPSAGGGSSKKKSSSSSTSDCTGDFAISGSTIMSADMVPGPNIDNPGGFPQDGQVFMVGVPSEQATIDANDGTFCLALTSQQIADAGYADGDTVSIMAWWVAVTFVEFAGVREEITLSSSVDTGLLTLDWTKADHVRSTDIGSDTVTGVTFTGITDPALGVDMWRGPTGGGAKFDSNYLPEGVYPIVVETDGPQTLTGDLHFNPPDPGASTEQWDTPTITLQ